MNAIVVSVDYSDILAITIPYNRSHFDRVLVVTTYADRETERVARANGADVYLTDAFTRGGALFNKFLALEEGLDALGRTGRLTIMDADVLWPVRASGWFSLYPEPGFLYTPRRRMADPAPRHVPPESAWASYPLHPQDREFAGYSQTFDTTDSVLGPPPWHAVDYTHAGTADSFFQAKWPDSRKIRPPFEVLHLGPAGVNWAGRTSPYLDGTIPAGAAERQAELRRLIRMRRPGPDRFRAEKLP